MNTSGIENNLIQAAKNLAAEWQRTRTYWNDTKSHEFEGKYLESLPHHVARAATVIAEINAVLKKMRNDCG